MNKNRIAAPAFLLSAFVAALFISPAAAAGWEPGIAVPSEADAVSAGAGRNWEDPEAFRAEVVRLVNLERANNGLDVLAETRALTDMADIRAEESAVSFSHTRPDGADCSGIFSDCGIGYSAAGENLSCGFSTPSELVAAWMGSESHRANILSEKFTCLGVGLCIKEDGRIYCAQLFYAPPSP